MVGERSARLVVLETAWVRHGKGMRTFCVCMCDCGKRYTVLASIFSQGRAKSCGCLRRSVRTTHGDCTSLTYMSWQAMKARCRNPRARAYARYGGRGITVCQRWARYEAFAADVGSRPSRAHTLERVDNSRGYEPGNVRWATRLEQQQNNSRTRLVTHQGRTLSLAGWERATGIPDSTLGQRLDAGMSVAEAFAVVPRSRRRARS